MLLQEACEVWNYSACVEQETNPRIKVIWERFLDYELGHLHVVMDLCKSQGIDPAELLGDGQLPAPIAFKSHRKYLREVIATETQLRKDGDEFVDESEEGETSRQYRKPMNSEGSLSETVSATYRWTAGTELARPALKRAA